VITHVSSSSYESASLALASDPAANLDAPISYYTITSSKGDVKKVNSWRELTVTVSGLKSATSYTFTVTATTADGTSPVSASSLPVTTPAYVPPTPAPTTAPLAAPAFTLSASAETKTVNTAITGYAISSTGGTIASYAISPAAPTGLIFNTTTGVLSGTPASTQSATTYTITATNASGTATQTFTLTVTPVVYTVGQTGPGGGIIFYIASSPFACGPTLNLTCTRLEVAPTTGAAAWSDAQLKWSSDDSQSHNSGGNRTGIGTGYSNTLAMLTTSGSYSADTSEAAYSTQLYSGPNSKSDWYLPSKDELNQLCKWQRGQAWVSDSTICNASGSINSSTYGATNAGFSSGNYWSSTESQRFPWASTGWNQEFHSGSQYNSYGKNFQLYTRAIRAF
jgi:hypothetical protein